VSATLPQAKAKDRLEEPRGPGTLSAAAALLSVELKLEGRTTELVPGMVLFVLSAFVVFHFALNRGALEGDLAAGVLCVALLFGALLAVNRLFVRELEQGGFEALLLAPVPPAALFLAKTAALFIYLCLLELVGIPAYALLLLARNPVGVLGGVVGVLALTNLGIAVLGGLVSALTVRSRARELLAPLLFLPLLLPLLIGAASALSPLLAGHAPTIGRWLASTGGKWLTVLGLYDLIFGLIASALFDFLLED
jgi:heme exporter protein B